MGVSSDLQTHASERLIESWRDGKRCGPNSLYVLLRLAGRRVSYSQVQDVITLHENGVSIDELENASRELGLALVSLRAGSIEDLECYHSPFIAHLSGNREGHFLVVLRIDEKKQLVTVADAISCEIQQFSVSEFCKQWSGFVLVQETQYRWDRIRRVFRMVFVVLSFWISVLVARFVRRRNQCIVG